MIKSILFLNIYAAELSKISQAPNFSAIEQIHSFKIGVSLMDAKYFGEMKLFLKGMKLSFSFFLSFHLENAVPHPSESADGKRDNHSKESNTRFMLLPFVFCTTCISLRFCYVIFGCKCKHDLITPIYLRFLFQLYGYLAPRNPLH